ncbi:FAD/NAD(P)-binding domain-containing protein [Rhizoclosmatium globosum]|uniref:FAD/NAD(P)-binding domain-containing protein n=1 Tax=Rhizoclosmatium globosum TaxID=329046 RepID=A0A1Y2CEY7_9FUNG|nr:FAD/NAD(P)-binding domain-containing protein [Rhizoclosmatium globosum]|eukprot:ORY45457.1 FAD/NAD(P)-binding domain-containing protein [Rhizoclosmatium globosum]
MHALIIGSGLVGAATALALNQVGINSTLYDKVDLVQAALESNGAPVAVEFGDSGGSVMLKASALRVLRTLGLLDEVMAVALPSPSTNWFKINGSSSIELDTVNATKKGGELDPQLQPAIQILRSKLHNIFMQACHRAGIRCFTGKKLIKLTESVGSVSVEFQDGSTATGDFVIGADGVHSAVRRFIFGEDSKAEFTGCIGHIGVVRLKENNITLKETCAFYLEREKKQMVCTFKVSEEMAAVQVMTFNDPQPVEGEEYRPYADLPKESTRLADIMKSWGVPNNIEMMMRKSFRISPAAIYDLPDLPEYHKGRILLIGDSAHGMVPNAGLGLLTGLEDVGVLLELFRHFKNAQDLDKVFKLYSQLRVPRGHDAAARSRKMADQYYGGSTALGHFKLRVGIFLFNYNLVTFHTIYDYPTEVKKAISELEGH